MYHIAVPTVAVDDDSKGIVGLILLRRPDFEPCSPEFAGCELSNSVGSSIPFSLHHSAFRETFESTDPHAGNGMGRSGVLVQLNHLFSTVWSVFFSVPAFLTTNRHVQLQTVHLLRQESRLARCAFSGDIAPAFVTQAADRHLKARSNQERIQAVIVAGTQGPRRT